MFMMSFRLRRSGMVIGGVILAFVLVLGISGIGNVWPWGASVTAEAVTKGGGEIKLHKAASKTNEDRLGLIASLGWEVEAEPAEVVEVIIPKEFDEIYTKYNGIQKKQGCDLQEYAGKRCKKFSYTVTNYPGTDQPVRLNLLVYKNKVIGGDVCSLDANGFIHGLALPE